MHIVLYLLTGGTIELVPFPVNIIDYHVITLTISKIHFFTVEEIGSIIN